jgi:amino acid adenylation domain-containing protein
VGRPIRGCQVLLLDPAGRSAPPGEVGEICLGGVGIARGYLQRPALTAERFIPDPSPAADAGGRLYKSGDLARWNGDGDLVFLGRADHQVKVRGHRIELGEIEAALGEHAAVERAVAAVWGGGTGQGERRLVAYVVPRPNLAAGELRAFLAGKLPDFMVPAAFVFLDELPLLPTGKVDRRALPPPDRARPDLAVPCVPPRDPVERALAGIWGELLGLDRVGVLDNLFELGGHSLLVAQIVSRVRAELGVELPLLEVFERPTIAALAALIAAAPPAQASPQLPAIGRASRAEPIPLTFPQERVWFLLQLAPASIAYNFQFSIRLAGALRPELLSRALAEVIRRHEVLRTSFPAVDGRPVQVIHAPFAPRLPAVDLSGVARPVREPLLTALVRRALCDPFDVTRLPLLRWALFRLAPGDHLLLQVEHHFVHDGWSLAVYLREVVALYEAFAAGRPSPLPPPPIQYADFAHWQRRWLSGEVLAGQLAYWKEQLAPPLPLAELPTDRPRPRVASYRGGALRDDLPEDLYAAARAFCRREGITLFMAMLAAFDALLYRYTGQRDLVLGSGVANRRLKETEALVGMVVNTVVFRTRLSGEIPFRELLARVRRTTLEAHVHQDMPFEKLVEELAPERDLSRNPIFQVLFSFHDAPVPDLLFAGLSGDLFEWHNGSAKADLNVVVKPRAEQRVGRRPMGGEQLTMQWEYSSDLFDPTTIERQWGHYRTLLGGAIDHPEHRLRELPLLTAAEERQLAAWNRTQVPLPGARPVHRLFFEQARREPAALALSADPRRLTYGELAARAERLAGRLRRMGVGPGGLVAVLTERRAELAVGAVAALSTGAAYLPLDPAYPAERLLYMVEDSRAAVLLARPEYRGAVPGCPVPILVVGEEEPTAAAPSRKVLLPSRDEDPDELAYVIYTSGSTGRPKGVEATHGGLANLVAWHREAYGVTAADRATLVAGPAFDASVWELWPYLAAGASLHLPDAETRGTPSRLLAWLAREAITLAFLPTPLAEAALEAEVPEDLALKALLTGGDRLRRPPRPCLPFRLVNHYGPTEGTVVTTAGEVAATAPGAASPAIGRPIANTRIHLLDRDGSRVPVGVPGELYVGGAGLARGYRGRPALTAERFVPHPFSGGEAGPPGGRLYRTGDLVRLLPGGQVDFLGRRDFQVKVRGFRVELGEIEVALAGHPAVQSAAVGVVPATAAGEPAAGGALVAWYVPAGEAEPGELASHLRAKLPEYMVPAAWVRLARLPLTPNGKLDRRALPMPDPAARQASEVAPRTHLEELIAALWSGLLAVPAVGAHDDFFRLGGHSLLATRMLARLRAAVGAEVPLASLFEHPTVAGLAAVVGSLLRSPEAGPASGPPLVPRRLPGPSPLSLGQERLWFLEQLFPGTAAYHIVRAFALRGPLEVSALARALRGVVGRHGALATGFQAEGGRPFQVVAARPRLALPVLDLQGLQEGGRRAETLRAREAGRPFALERGPLLRAALVRWTRSQHLLLLTLHHLVADGWSMPLLYRELGALYSGAPSEGALSGRALSGGPIAGHAPALPALPVQYADFAAWQRQRLAGEVLAGLLAYWKRHLEGAPELLELPTDRPRPAVQRYRGAGEKVLLPPGALARLGPLLQATGATPFMALLAAFAALLGRYACQGRVVVGTPVAGRGAAEVEDLIGFFVNTLPLSIRLDGGPSLRDLVARARAAVLAGHAHQELPVEKLVEELAPARNLSHSPLYQVLFTLQAGPAETLSLAGLEVQSLEVRRRESRFDLELAVTPAKGGWAASFQYDTDLFDPTTVRRWGGHFGNLLAGAVADPDRPVAELPLLAAAERHQLLAEWQGSTPGDLAEALLHRPVAAQAVRRPDAVAVELEDSSLSYAGLARAARGLARPLRLHGVGPDVPVGISLDRSLELVVGLLGILEAGGAYVPLDPTYPAERLAGMLQDLAATGARAGEGPLLLTEDGAGEAWQEKGRRLPGLAAGSVAALTGAEDDGGDLPHPQGPLPDNLAYVIFTSGSTGRPKGAMNTHRALCNRLRWMQEAYGLGPDDRVLQKTPASFDVSVWEFFWPLSTGAKLVLARPGGHRDGAYLRDLLVAARISTVHFVPSMLQAFLETPDLPRLPGLVRLVASGEALPRQAVERSYLRLGGGFVLHNLYGPTEAAVDVTFRPCPPGEASASVPIGRPIHDTAIHLVAAAGGLAPVGMPGELHIAGVSLARGYLGRPGLTAERFVPDPFAGRPGGRLYATGDRARALPDGEIEYLGRLDHQVKLRGFRIELGEIEARLAAHPGISQAAVVLREDRPGDRRLVAYLAAGDGQPPPETAELRDYLKARLPDHMVPASFVLLPTLPRTPSGKVDRRALPAPDASRSTARAFVAPRTADEAHLAGIWSRVLGVDPVGVEDSFFDLGGHSLLATQVIARVRSELAVELPLRAFFQAPTVAGLAQALEAARREMGPTEVSRIVRLSRQERRRPRPGAPP